MEKIFFFNLCSLKMSEDFRLFKKNYGFMSNVNSNLIINLILYKFIGAKKDPLGTPGLHTV